MESENLSLVIWLSVSDGQKTDFSKELSKHKCREMGLPDGMRGMPKGIGPQEQPFGYTVLLPVSL